MFTTARFPLLVVAATLFLPPAGAAVVTLQNPTATYSQTGFLVAEALTGGTTGWAVLANPATGAFETAVDVGHAGGTALTFVLDHQYGGSHNLGRFRLSVTTDDRSTFCDGLPNGGDVTANWTVLLPTAMMSGGGATFTRPSDGVMVVTGTNPARDTYTITALTNLTGITGVRLETFRDDSDPITRGPGRASSHNFVLTNFTLAEAQYTGPPQWNADADGNWSNTANWVGSVPNAAGATAELRSATTAPRTVAVDSPATIGTIHFENANAYTIGGPSALILQGSAGTAAINVAGGSHTISAPLVLNDPTAVAVSGGSSLGIIGGIDGAGGLSKQGAGTLVVNQAGYGGATVIEQGTLRLLNNPPPGSPLAGGTVWFDAADTGTLTVDGSNNVTEWRSKVGANNLAGVNPSTITYHTSGGGPNDQAYVRTAGTSYLDFDSDISDARTLFMVFKPTANPTAYTPFFGLNPESSPATGGNYMGTAGAGIGYVENTYSAPGLRTTGTTPAQWFLDGAAFDPVNTPLSLTDYRVISVAAGANVRVENIGRDRTDTNRSLRADIGEVLIYSSVLSEADRQAVEAYLLNKWLGVVQTGYGNGSLPASTALQIGSAGTFDLNGNHPTVASLADHGGAGGTVTNSHGTPAVLTVDAAAGSTTFTGSIADGAGGVSLVKSGDSTQVLAGPGVSTYTGGTIINGGVLEVRRGAGSGSRGGLGASPVVINAGTLRLNSDDYNALGAGTGCVPVTIEAGGTLTADNTANNAHNLGLLTLNGGTLTSINGPAGPANDNGLGNFLLRDGVVVGGSSMSTISATTLAVYGAFNVADATSGVDLDVSSRIILATPLLKTGEGTMQLTGSNTYTGGTTVAAGTLTLSGGGRLGGGTYNAPITIVENAVLNFNMANSQNLGGDITGKGTLAQNSTASYLYMTGDHSGFEGTFHNVAGNMYLASSSANSPASAAVRVDGGALQIAPNGSADGTWTIGALSGTGGAVQPNNNLVGRTITIEVGGLDSDTTYGGILRNNTNATPSVLALTKVGSGTLTLSGANNTYSGGTTVEAGILQVAATRALGAGPIRIDGGTVRLATNAYNALGTPEPAIVIESGGVLTANNTTNNAHNLGALTLNGGMLSSNTVENVHGNFILNAGVTTGGASMSTINATAVSLRNTGGIFNVANATGGTDLLVLSRVINHPGLAGALTKTGAGTLELAGANTYTGGTVVNAGTLLVSNTAGSGTGSGAVSVNSGATLGGTGRIGSHVNVNSSGSLAPGTSVGTLYLDGGNLTFDQNAFFDVDIDTFGLADLVQMDGGLLSPNEATIRVNLGFSPELGDSWTILQGEGSRDSDFNTQVLVPSGGELLGWMWFDVSYGNSVILTVVPEPGTGLLLLAAAAFGMMVRRRS